MGRRRCPGSTLPCAPDGTSPTCLTVVQYFHLAALSQQAHQLAAAGDEAGLAAVEAQVDEAVAELWSITRRELKEIRRSLEEVG